MDDRGRIVCGMHNTPWCPICSEDERRRIEDLMKRRQEGFDVEGRRRPAPSGLTAEDRERMQRELQSIGLGKKGRGKP